MDIIYYFEPLSLQYAQNGKNDIIISNGLEGITLPDTPSNRALLHEVFVFMVHTYCESLGLGEPYYEGY